MLTAKDLHSGYGQLEILHGLSFDIEKEEIVGIVGSSGMGKSTLIKTLTGLVPLYSGLIMLDGKNITGLSPIKVVKYGIAQVPERRRIFGALTVSENLSLGLYHFGHLAKQERRKRLESIYQLFPVLKGRSNQLGGTLSGGEQQMLAIARALLMKPHLLMLDEPYLGLAPIIVDQLGKVFTDLNQEGLTIILAEQNVKAVSRIVDRLYLIELGTFKGQIRPEDSQAEKIIEDFYLGRSTARIPS